MVLDIYIYVQIDRCVHLDPAGSIFLALGT